MDTVPVSLLPIPITTVHGAIVDCVFPFFLRIEGSTERLMRPVQSTIGLFERHVLVIGKLVKEFAPGAVWPSHIP